MNAIQALRAPAFVDQTPPFIRFSNAAESYRRAKDALMATGGKKAPDVQLQLLELALEAKMDEHRVASALDLQVNTVRVACKRYGVNLADFANPDNVKIRGLADGMKAFREFVAEAEKASTAEEVVAVTQIASKTRPQPTAAPMPLPEGRVRRNTHEARAAVHAAIREHVLARGETPSKRYLENVTGMANLTVRKHWPTDQQISAWEDEYLTMSEEQRAEIASNVVEFNTRAELTASEVAEGVVFAALEMNPLYKPGGFWKEPTKAAVMTRTGKSFSTCSRYWPTEEQIVAGMDAELERGRAMTEELSALSAQQIKEEIAADGLGADPFGEVLGFGRYVPPTETLADDASLRTSAEAVAKYLHGDEFIEGVYMDADGNWASDRIINSGDGFRPQIHQWRNHVEVVARVLAAYEEMRRGA